MESQIIRFLRNEAKDFKGRSLLELIGKTDHQLERTPYVIKWMFPIDISSKNSFFVPVLTPTDISIIQNDAVIQQAIKVCLERMISFYEANDWWISQKNHNFKRLTRILRCLWLAGMKHDYVCLQKALDEIFVDYQDIVGEETYLYWKNANNDEFLKNPEKFISKELSKKDWNHEQAIEMPAWFAI